MKAMMERMKKAREEGDQQTAHITSTNLAALFKEHNVNPFASIFMPILQIPIFLGMFSALRKLADLPLPGFKEGGFGWVTDLTLSDPYYILPITSILLQVTMFKVGIDGTGQNPSSARMMAHFRNGMLFLSPILLYTIGQMPAVSWLGFI
jgi:YidC/Oxa1 family membrane protein insertase